MKRPGRFAVAAVALMAASIIAAPIASQAGVKLGNVLKGGALALAVTQYGPQIDDAINKLTGYKDELGEKTKVVPIISAGKGTYLGAAQVAGPPKAIDEVKAVAQLETKLVNFRIKALVPVNTVNPVAKPARIRGVGVTGVVDVKL